MADIHSRYSQLLLMADIHSRYSQAGSVMKLRVLLNRALGGGLAIFLCVSLKAEDEKVCVELLTDLSEIQIIIEVKRKSCVWIV